jgi:hypothetical protein
MRNSAVPPGRKQESSAILERQLKMTEKRSSKEAKPQTVFGQARNLRNVVGRILCSRAHA